MTKHIVVDEGFPKYHMPLEEANKIIEENMKILDSNTLGICPANVKSIHKIDTEPTIPTSNRATKPKINLIKNRLGKIMHKLYDLEPDNTPEKPLNVDLCVDLYQMENF